MLRCDTVAQELTNIYIIIILIIIILPIIIIIIYPCNIVVCGNDSLRYSSQTIKLCKQHVLEKHGRWGDQSQPKGFDRHILEAWAGVATPKAPAIENM